MTEKENRLKLEKRVERLEKTNWQKIVQETLGVCAPHLEQLAREAVENLEVGLNNRMNNIIRQTDNLDGRLGNVEMALKNVESRLASLGNCLTPDVVDSIRTTCNRLAREAVSLQLGITDVAPLHGARWAGDDERKLYKQFNSFLRAQSVNLGRTESGLRIKLMRLLRDEHPVDWQIAGKDR